MLARTETIATIADHWLARFERALAEPDDVLLKTLFHPDSHWRDVLALTWQIRTVNGLDAILRELKAHIGRAHPAGLGARERAKSPRSYRAPNPACQTGLPWNLISQRRLRLLREAVQVGKELLIDEVVEIVAGLGGVVVELAVLALRAAQLSQRYGFLPV